MTPREVNIVVLSRLLRAELAEDHRTWSSTIADLEDIEITVDREGKLS